MPDIITITQCIAPFIAKTELKQLRQLVLAMLCTTGRVTMVGLSRWTERGFGYRTIQRWFAGKIEWGALLWAVVEAHLVKPGGTYLLAADEVVVSKAGKATHRVGRFYSSIAGRPIRAVSFLAVSVVADEQRKAYPVRVVQRIPAPKAARSAQPVATGRRGRPKGSKNHAKAVPVLNAEQTLLYGLLGALLRHMGVLKVRHLVMDGFFGNYTTSWLAAQHGLHLISKLHHNAALCFPYTGPKPRRGPTPRYGDRLDYAALPSSARVERVVEGRFLTETYALTLWHKDFPDKLNVLVIVKTDTRAHKHAHVVLFSTDLSLSPTQLADYYALRFQIEFNFRDAKQYFGLDDFMNISQPAVTNAVGLAFLMVNLSAILLAAHRSHLSDFSILDLKALFRARRYLHETIIALPESPHPNIISRIWQRLSVLGAIRPLVKFRNAA
jgi:putative transposase